jgi:DNA-binding NarL/FixJ family response regulator
MTKIMLVDDHKLIRDGVKSYLERNKNYQIVAEATNGKEALEFLKSIEVDLLIMDINMKVMDGITCTREVLRLYPEKKVLALTMLNENQHIKQMLAAGAAGYLLKNCDEEELITAINSIINYGSYYSPQVTKTIMNSLSTNKPKVVQGDQIPLTDREKEVLHLILKEYANKEIAKTLFISPRTVDAHKRNLLEKTGSRNTAGLVLYAINNQLFDDL